MTLQTPRRRISPRTKHRYRVIRNFFRKALGTTQSEIKISSSIAINVTDLKRKIIGLEHQLSEVNRHCQELASSESISSKKPNSFISVELEKDLETLNTKRVRSSKNKLYVDETKVLYKPPEFQFKESDQVDTTPKTNNDINGSQLIAINSEYTNKLGTEIKKKKRKLNNFAQNLHKRKTVSACENSRSVYSSSSFHTVVDSRMSHCFNGIDGYVTRHQPKLFSNQYIDAAPIYKNEVYRAKTKINSNDTKTKKSNRNTHQLDQDFIADIIKKQYKPIKMFGRRDSDVSQFSAPVCRDQEYSVRENIQVDPELCSCCHDRHPQNINRQDRLNEMRSVCDTRLYSATKYPRTKRRRRQLDPYKDSEFYDLIPVKEKTSPKSRRKFVADTMITYDYYREVPPSPRTLRPRLNLTAQYYTEFDDYVARKHLTTKCSPTILRRTQEHGENVESDGLYETEEECNVVKDKSVHQNKIIIQKQQETKQDNATESNSLGHVSPNFVRIQNVTVDTSLNKTQDTDLSIDKTDKALCEIKDILQNFLQEIKKEATASQCDKSDITSKAAGAGNINNQRNANASIKPNSGQSCNNYTMAHCGVPSFIAPFSNPCCYPILPVCPMNCMQNGYIVPNSSVSCAKCSNNKDTNDEQAVNNNSPELHTPETEELIKKIYKYVTQSPRDRKKECDYTDKRKEAKLLTSRSVGGSTRAFKHDVKVGTPTMKCYSKSCEAIGSRMLSDAYYNTTNPTYSDTILEKLSLEVTPTETISETDCTAITTSGEKSKRNRLTKILQSFGIKRKKDVIEELSESDSTIEVEVKSKPQPFRQEVTNYMMNKQEYYHPPPIPPMHTYPERRHEFQECREPYPPGIHHKPIPEIHNPHLIHQQTIHEHKNPYNPPLPIPTAPPYSQSFDSYIPSPQNIPLCLKEIEVKSVGTQSDRKMSFLQKMKTKVPSQSARSKDYAQKNCSTQTSQNKPGLFNWKNMENKSNKDANPMAFSYLKQKQLAEGDFKMRNAMMKRLFYKRNPFSPGNLLVRTLLGKDKSSFGQPPTMYKPRMFF